MTPETALACTSPASKYLTAPTDLANAATMWIAAGWVSAGRCHTGSLIGSAANRAALRRRHSCLRAAQSSSHAQDGLGSGHGDLVAEIEGPGDAGVVVNAPHLRQLGGAMAEDRQGDGGSALLHLDTML
jgi:hypothetical protein